MCEIMSRLHIKILVDQKSPPGPLGGPKGPWVGPKTAKIELKWERLNIVMWFLWQKCGKKLALNVKKIVLTPPPPFWTPGCPEGSPKEGKNGSRRDAGRTVEYFHVVPLAKMWQIVRGRWWKKNGTPGGRKGAPKVGKTGPGGILREPFDIFMWFLLEKCGKWWWVDDKKIPYPRARSGRIGWTLWNRPHEISGFEVREVFGLCPRSCSFF